MITPNGAEIIESGLRASGIQEVIRITYKGLPTIDRFEDFDSLTNDNEAANDSRGTLA